MERSSALPASPPAAAAPGWTLRGRYFVGPFLVVLLLLLGAILSIAFRFQSIMQRLDSARTVWPAASSELAGRYAAIDARLAADPQVEESGWTKTWRSEYAAFGDTSQYDRQAQHASRLEALIASHNLAGAMPQGPEIQRWLQAEEARRQAQGGLLGRTTVEALRLQLPMTFDPRP
jgi:hypothetical protein